jgi:GNAT superfamily N-acetyltransferase
MADVLVNLYSLREVPREIEGVEIRRPLPHPEWAEEFETTFKSFPVTAFIALREEMPVGFACYEATCRGFFGPTAVLPEERGKGIGKQLLIRSMCGLRELGYAYGIVGGAGPTAFYVKALGGFLIPGSTPGIYPARKIRT